MSDHEFTHLTAAGKRIPLSEMTDDYLVNIVRELQRFGMHRVTFEYRCELERRNLTTSRWMVDYNAGRI